MPEKMAKRWLSYSLAILRSAIQNNGHTSANSRRWCLGILADIGDDDLNFSDLHGWSRPLHP